MNGKQLKQFMKTRSLRDVDMASRIGVGLSTLHRFLADKPVRNASRQVIEQFCLEMIGAAAPKRKH